MLDPPELDDTSVAQYLAERGRHELVRRDAGFSRRQAVLAAREQMFADRLAAETARQLKPGWLKAKPYKGRRSKRIERTMHVAFGDWHFGSRLSRREVPVQYGPHEEARRVGKVVADVADRKREHRHETRLMVSLLGDMFDGIIHDSGQDALVLQMLAVERALFAGLHLLSQEFQEVFVTAVPGNHGRIPSMHPERAIYHRWDALEVATYSHVAQLLAASGHTNVHFQIPQTQYAIADFNGHRAFVIHGDTVFNAGRPNKSINVGNLFKQMCWFNLSRNINGPFAIYLAGHVHFWSVTEPLPGSIMITNSALVPPSHFAVSTGAVDCACAQYTWESTPDYAHGDARNVNVDDADGMAEFERIVPPSDGELEPSPVFSTMRAKPAPRRQVKNSIQARAARKAAVTRTRDKGGRFAAEKRAV